MASDMTVMRHDYRELSEDEKRAIRDFKDMGLNFYRYIETIELNTGQSRELSLAKTKIEEAVMWATKALTG